MRLQSRDTKLAAEQVQLRLLAQATVARRFARARSLTKTTVQLAIRALRRRHPDSSEGEIFVMFVALNYGERLANALRDDLQRRGLL